MPVGRIEKTGVVDVEDRVVDEISIAELDVGMMTMADEELELDSVVAEGVRTVDGVVSEATVVEGEGVVSGVEAGVDGTAVSVELLWETDELEPGVVWLEPGVLELLGRGVIGVVGTAEESLGVALESEVATGVDAEPGVPVRDERIEVKSIVVGVLSGMIGVVGMEISGVDPSREDRIDSTPVTDDEAAGVEPLVGVGVASEAPGVVGMVGRGVKTEVRSLPTLETKLVTPEISELRSLVSGRGMSRPLLLLVGVGVRPGVVIPAADSLSPDAVAPVSVGVRSLADEVTGGIAVPVPA